jgi:hypothetical protein
MLSIFKSLTLDESGLGGSSSILRDKFFFLNMAIII